METITIPKKIVQNDDLIIIPRRKYEALIKLRTIREFTPTPVQRKALLKAESNLKKGKTLSYDELAGKLGSAD